MQGEFLRMTWEYQTVLRCGLGSLLQSIPLVNSSRQCPIANARRRPGLRASECCLYRAGNIFARLLFRASRKPQAICPHQQPSSIDGRLMAMPSHNSFRRTKEDEAAPNHYLYQHAPVGLYFACGPLSELNPSSMLRSLIGLI